MEQGTAGAIVNKKSGKHLIYRFSFTFCNFQSLRFNFGMSKN
jgi:hypothetical protein